MRPLLLALCLAAPAAAQFTPPGQTDDVALWGVHFDSSLRGPLDRITALGYDDGGAGFLHLETAVPLYLYGIGLLLATNDPDAGSVEPGRAVYAPLLFDLAGGGSLVATPFGEAGVGLDMGLTAMSSTQTSNEGAIVLTGGPNVNAMSRPIENLHLVGHLAYQLVYPLTGAPASWRNGMIEADLTALWPIGDSFGVYGGVQARRWSFLESDAENADRASFQTFGIFAGVKVSTRYLFAIDISGILD